jgi:hypothetical protein
MLCQLVCTDRRYARMNCFNIRELQGILKRRFFVDLVNAHDHKDVLSNTMIGLKHRLYNNDNIYLEITTFYNWGMLKNQNYKVINFNRNESISSRLYISLFNMALTDFFNVYVSLKSFFNMLVLSFYNMFYLINFTSLSIAFFSTTYTTIITFFLNSFYIFYLNFSMLKSETFFFTLKTYYDQPILTNTSLFFSKDINSPELITNFSFTENSSFQRLTRFSTPLIGYDYKTGHYLGLSEKLYPQLIMSFIEVARGIRKPT